MSIFTLLVLFVLGGFMSDGATAAHGGKLPCREWTSCGEPVCTTEEEFQRAAIFNFPSHCSTPGRSSGNFSSQTADSACVPVDGACNFTENVLSCRSWLPECTQSYRCGTEQEYQQYLNDSAAIDVSCPTPANQLPASDALCTQIDGECLWYDPCRTWQGFCYGPYLCGSEGEFWAYQFGPQPVCLPGHTTDQEPPGRCLLQEDQCAWSECRAWLDWCQTSWECGTQYEYEWYQAGPIPSCAPRGFPHQPPSQPGECKFNLSAGACQFFEVEVGPVCPEGKVWMDCGTPCRLTCDNYERPPPCLPGCASGCFCPQGMVENGDECVLPSDCPPIDPCTRITCATGYICQVYEPTNAAYCDPTCQPLGEFCEEGQECRLLEGDCSAGVPCQHQVQCVTIEVDPCALVDCQPGYTCRVYEPTNAAYCDPTCEPLGEFCEEEQECRLVEGDCSAGVPCPRQVQCINTVEVTECTVASCAEGRRCLVQGSPPKLLCLQSCFVDNGGCRDDQLCINNPADSPCKYGLEACATVECIDYNGTLTQRCTPGLEYTCGSACRTCEKYIAQQLFDCPSVCLDGCFCPDHLVAFRDRCVDPLECWSLLNDPPPIDPLPMPSNTVLLELVIPSVTIDVYTVAEDEFLASVYLVLEKGNRTSLQVVVYATQEKETDLMVYLSFTIGGAEDTELNGDELATVITENNDLLSLDVTGVSAVTRGPAVSPTPTPEVEDTEESDDDVSDGVIASVAVAVAFLLTCCVILVIAVAVIVVVKGRTPKVVMVKPAMDMEPKEDPPKSYSKTFQEIATLQNDYVEQPY